MGAILIERQIQKIKKVFIIVDLVIEYFIYVN